MWLMWVVEVPKFIFAHNAGELPFRIRIRIVFKVCKSVHHHTVQINHQLDAKICKSMHYHTFNCIKQQDAAISQVYYLSFRYSSTCFGHPHAHHQELQQLQ
jgi:hypothetical protein